MTKEEILNEYRANAMILDAEWLSSALDRFRPSCESVERHLTSCDLHLIAEPKTLTEVMIEQSHSNLTSLYVTANAIADWLSDASEQFPQMTGHEAEFRAFCVAADAIRNRPDIIVKKVFAKRFRDADHQEPQN